MPVDYPDAQLRCLPGNDTWSFFRHHRMSGRGLPSPKRSFSYAQAACWIAAVPKQFCRGLAM